MSDKGELIVQGPIASKDITVELNPLDGEAVVVLSKDVSDELINNLKS